MGHFALYSVETALHDVYAVIPMGLRLFNVSKDTMKERRIWELQLTT